MVRWLGNGKARIKTLNSSPVLPLRHAPNSLNPHMDILKAQQFQLCPKEQNSYKLTHRKNQTPPKKSLRFVGV